MAWLPSPNIFWHCLRPIAGADAGGAVYAALDYGQHRADGLPFRTHVLCLVLQFPLMREGPNDSIEVEHTR